MLIRASPDAFALIDTASNAAAWPASLGALPGTAMTTTRARTKERPFRIARSVSGRRPR